MQKKTKFIKKTNRMHLFVKWSQTINYTENG